MIDIQDIRNKALDLEELTTEFLEYSADAVTAYNLAEYLDTVQEEILSIIHELHSSCL